MYSAVIILAFISITYAVPLHFNNEVNEPTIEQSSANEPVTVHSPIYYSTQNKHLANLRADQTYPMYVEYENNNQQVNFNNNKQDNINENKNNNKQDNINENKNNNKQDNINENKNNNKQDNINKNKNNNKQDNINPDTAVVQTTFPFGGVIDLLPISTRIMLFSKQIGIYLLRHISVILVGLATFSLLCTYTSICNLIYPKGNTEVQELARMYMTPEILSDLTSRIYKAFDLYNSSQN